jgi:rifampicin phosphotransferase
MSVKSKNFGAKVAMAFRDTVLSLGQFTMKLSLARTGGSRSRHVEYIGTLAACLWIGSVVPGWAIPSPELLIGSISSISQLLTLGAASLGGAAALGFGLSAKRAANAKSAQRMVKIAAGLLVVMLASLAANVYQYRTTAKEQQERLEATLVRPSRDPGAPVADPNLKELNFSQQVRHPRGIGTQDTQKLIDEMLAGKRNDVVLLDVRESAEAEMGSLPNATIVRWPDIAKSNLDLKGKIPVIFCHNGNRSHETCDALAAQGIDCRFVVGGLEKWVVEGRKMTGLDNRNIDTLRAIPDHRNSRTLLDTPDVKDLVKNEKALFVDVRYPGEFAQRRLPDAVNLTIRTTPTDELKAKINALPKRPIILPCYDRRSCFFSEVMGLELTRAGHDYRGRYTVPWEYYAESARPPHVVEWQRLNDRSTWSRVVDWVSNLLVAASKTLPFMLVIIVLALLSRLIVLPISLKAERDQITAKAIDGDVEALKSRFADDPARLQRAMKGLYAKHGMTPGRNLLGLLFLPLLTISVASIELASTQVQGTFLWLKSAADQDPFYILPLAFAATICFYLDSVFGKTPRQRLLIFVIGMAALTWMTAYLGAGAGLYVLTSGVLIVLQRLIVTAEKGVFRRFWNTLGTRPVVTPGIVPLQQAEALVACGNKAYRLARLKAAGVSVPDGVVLETAFLERYNHAPQEARAALLTDVWKHLKAGRVAVRSSAAGEDGADHSFAGVFDSILHVEPATLPSAVDQVLASFKGDRAGAYGVSAAGANILIQAMVDAEFAGVCFTRAPTSAGQMMVEMVRGTADEFVSGAATPETFLFGRVTSLSEAGRVPPIDVTPLLAIAHQAEALFGRPQDIEWTWKNGVFAIVQSRDITTTAIGDADALMIEDERARLLARFANAPANEPVLVRNELAELLPRPSPLSLSLMEQIWSAGGSVDLACRALGMDYAVTEDAPSYLVPVFGRLYLDSRQQHARAPVVSRLLFRRLVKGADAVESDLRNGLFRELEAEGATLAAVDFNRMETADLFRTSERLRNRFVTETYAEVEMVNILASLFVERARDGLGKAGIDTSAILSISGGTSVSAALAEAAARTGQERNAILVRAMGHRAAFDYELRAPRHIENPEALERMLDGWSRPEAEAPLPTGLNKKLTLLVQLARRFQILKEDAKHMAMKDLAALRRVVLAIDDRLALDGLAFCMTFDELKALGDGDSSAILETARRRRAEAEAFADLPGLPSSLSTAQLEAVNLKESAIVDLGEGVLSGKRVAGARAVEGRARVIGSRDAEAGTPIIGVQPGTIIVAPMIPHAWLPHFREISGLVCDIGGFLSHTAIVAREFDLPMTVGVTQWKAIPDGAMIRIETDGSVSILEPAQRAADVSLEAAE